MSNNAHPTSDGGFTIIEVMVAMLILIVGVLGTVSLIESGLASTSRTTAREQGTNLARDLVERSRQLDYADVSVTNAPTGLRDALPATDIATAVTGAAPDSTFQVTRRGVTYKVKVFACAIDDPADGIGKGTPQFCAADLSGPGDPPPDPMPAIAGNVLGVTVDVTGSLLNTVCNALGNAAVISELTGLVPSALGSVSVCPAGSPVSDANLDSNADDMRRVRIDVSWNRGGAGSLTQTTLITNPSQV